MSLAKRCADNLLCIMDHRLRRTVAPPSAISFVSAAVTRLIPCEDIRRGSLRHVASQQLTNNRQSTRQYRTKADYVTRCFQELEWVPLLDAWIASVWLKMNVKLSLYTSWGRLGEWNYGCTLSWIRYYDRVISKGLWPPRPPDLTPPDYFLWGYLKGRVYQNKPRTIDVLKANITEEIQTVTADVMARTY